LGAGDADHAEPLSFLRVSRSRCRKSDQGCHQRDFVDTHVFSFFIILKSRLRAEELPWWRAYRSLIFL